MLNRIIILLITLGALILLGSSLCFLLVNLYVPDPRGSDPQKDQYLFGFVATGIVGLLLLLIGSLLKLNPTHQRPPSALSHRPFPVQPPNPPANPDS